MNLPHIPPEDLSPPSPSDGAANAAAPVVTADAPTAPAPAPTAEGQGTTRREWHRQLRRMVGGPTRFALLYHFGTQAASIALYLMFFGYLTVAGLQLSDTGLTSTDVDAVFQLVFGLAGLVILLAVRRDRMISEDLRMGQYADPTRRRMTPVVLLVAFMLTFAADAVGTVAEISLNAITSMLGVASDGGTLAQFDEISGNLFAILDICLLGPVLEELLFRGVVMRRLQPLGRVFAIVTSSVLFGVLHGDFVQGPSAIAAGLIYGYIAMEYSIGWAMVLHVANNSLAAVESVTFSWLPGSDRLDDGQLLLGVICLIVLVVVRRRQIGAYLAEHRAAKGTYVGWTSLWFVAFMVICFVLALRALTGMA